MTWILSLIFFASAVVALLTSGIIWPRRRAPGGWYLFFLMCCCAVWALTDSLETISTSEASKILVAKLSYIGSLNIPPCFLMLALIHSQKENLVSGWKRAALWSIPVLVLPVVFTNEWHHLIWSGFSWDSDPISNVLYFHPGTLYWVTPAYAYLVFLLATIVLAKNALQSPRVYRLQAWGLVLTTLLPWISNIIYVFRLSPFPGRNLTSIFFTIVAIIMVINMRSLNLLDLVPVARHQLVEIMQDAMIVLDNQNRVVDLNPAAAKILDTSLDNAFGQQITTVLQRWPDITAQFLNVDQVSSELTFERDGEIRCFDLQISPLMMLKNSRMGRLISLRNITEYKNLFRAMEKMAITDSLTGLYNRRHFMLLAAREIEAALRYQRPIAVMMLDLDWFKKVNDSYGHLVGDQLLQGVAQICQDNSRKADLLARFGGEEFIFLLSETGIEGAYEVGERLRQEIAKLAIDTPHGAASVTASLGIATLAKNSENLDILIYQADQALYHAKNAGRNQTIIYKAEIES